MNKPILVILEGADKVGKTSVHKILGRETEHSILIIDRFIGSYIAYGEINGRNDPPKEELYEIENKLQELFTPLVVYLHAPIQELLLRSANAGEIWSEGFYIRNIQHHYEKYLDNTELSQVHIDTSTHTVKECVEIIKGVIDILRDDQE